MFALIHEQEESLLDKLLRDTTGNKDTRKKAPIKLTTTSTEHQKLEGPTQN